MRIIIIFVIVFEQHNKFIILCNLSQSLSRPNPYPVICLFYRGHALPHSCSELFDETIQLIHLHASGDFLEIWILVLSDYHIALSIQSKNYHMDEVERSLGLTSSLVFGRFYHYDFR